MSQRAQNREFVDTQAAWWPILLVGLLAGCASTPDSAEAPATADPAEVSEESVIVSRAGNCIAATWHDASLFEMALHVDDGNRSRDRDVEPGLHYVALRQGLPLPNGTGLPYPYNIRSMTWVHSDEYGTLSPSQGPRLRVIAHDEDEARQRARGFLEETSLADPASIEGWLEFLEVNGHANGVSAYEAFVGGAFRYPEPLVGMEASQSGLRSGSVKGSDWIASLSLPIYRVTPEAGFIELSALGDIEASLVAEPSFKEAADAVLEHHGIGPSTFDQLIEFDGFGRTSCGTQTLS